VDIVKATINIKDGFIQLEGPQEFVEKYLELYRPDASKWQTALPEKGEVKTKEKAPKRPRMRKPKTGAACVDKIRELIGAGYFKEPKAAGDIRNYLKEEKGLIYKANEIGANLTNLFNTGDLLRQKKGKVFEYYSNV